ncbi:hypothetical protein VNI00_001456 [Paramarasmius palmivorus]|uniref:Uncharacterized protein n=1 Tax=Paramarasmius palmivorus TaxID=297713 RepID=A0AAW0E2D7_9AGAR
MIMAKSEIDDIFASKGKGKAPPVPSTNSELSSEASSSKAKSGKKRKRKHEASTPLVSSTAETVVDPSAQVPSAKRQKADKKVKEIKSKPDKPATVREDEEKFKDSRGTGPRRKTDEGWLIYKEDELGINHEGGGNLAFNVQFQLMSIVVQTHPYAHSTVTVIPIGVLVVDLIFTFTLGSIEASLVALTHDVQRSMCSQHKRTSSSHHPKIDFVFFWK